MTGEFTGDLRAKQCFRKLYKELQCCKFSLNFPSSHFSSALLSLQTNRFAWQIFMDEEENLKKENCSFAAMKPRSTSSAASTSASRHRKGTRNGADGFVY
ncbi:hypothetical protein WN944_003398 [Citrus x changshan-huyou]|uniref:Uncharacterized protein n=1 Tax=Citrus x changshan-huyou TaxID=2935761 RepID=A0AAP0QGT2_9ROSI